MNRKILYGGVIAGLMGLAAVMPGLAEQPNSKQTFVNGQFESGFAGSYLASQYARRSGNYEAATQYLQDAYDTHPDNMELAKQLQGTLLLSGRINDAMNVARTIHARENNEAVSALLLTLDAVKNGDDEKAQDILKTSFKSVDGQLWLPLVSAWLEVNQGTLKKPLDIKSIKAATGRAAMIVQYHLALINDMAGFEKTAASNFKQAANDENPPVRVMEALMSFYERNDKPAELKPLVEAYIAQYPDFKAENIGVHNAKDGIAEVLFTMGSIMLTANLDQDAAIYLRLALFLRPDFPLVQITLADSYSDMQQYEIANELYSQINPQHSLYLSAQINRAVNFHHLGSIAKALELLDQLGKNKDAQYLAMVTKGDILRENLRFADAVDAYSQAMDLLPALESRHWGLLFARGASHERMKNWNQAEKDLQKALSLSEGQPEVLNYLGYLWLVRGKHTTKAKEMINNALSQRPNDPQIMDSMGWAYYLTGEYGKAARLLEKSLNMIPSDPTVNDHLGDVYWQQGRKNEARFQWERSLMFSPEPEQAETTRRKLKDGLQPPDMVSNSNEPPVVASQQVPPQDKATQ
ncbi:MAG: tetratricopeptide repeat protein [Alphaproteobacteria bacterium]